MKHAQTLMKVLCFTNERVLQIAASFSLLLCLVKPLLSLSLCWLESNLNFLEFRNRNERRLLGGWKCQNHRWCDHYFRSSMYKCNHFSATTKQTGQTNRGVQSPHTERARVYESQTRKHRYTKLCGHRKL